MKKRKLIISWLLVIIWMGVIFYLSNMNTTESNTKSKNTITEVIEKTVSTTNKAGITNKHPSEKKKQLVTELLNKPLRKGAHASVYFILSILLLHAILVTNKNKHKNLLVSFLITLLICFLYACSDEYHQTYIKGRTGQFSDVLIDTSGSFVGASISSLSYILVRKRKRKKKEKR